MSEIPMYYGRDGQPVDQAEMLRLFGDPALRRVAEDTIGEAWVSTVHLVLDHSFGLGGPPIIFETMIFGGSHNQWQARYTSEEQARAGHEAVVQALREGREPE